MLALCLGLGLASLLYARQELRLEPDRGSLVSEKDRYQQLSRAFQREFPETEEVVVLVEGGTVQARQAFVDDLVARLQSEPELFRDVFGRLELPFARTHALLYFDLAGLRKLLAQLEKARPLLKALGSESGLVPLMDQFQARGSELAPMLGFLNEVLELLLESLKTRGRYKYHSPWENVFFAGVPEDAPDELRSSGDTIIYNTLPGIPAHLVLLRPGSRGAQAAVTGLRQQLGGLSRSHPDIYTYITGETVLELDEMKSSDADARRATFYSLLLVAGLYLFAFRDIVRPLMIVSILMVSLAWTLGYATLVVGHLNLLTVTFGTILVGLGVDFGVNFLFRYQEERMAGRLPQEAMLTTMDLTGVENLTGAAGMAVAFWAIRFMDFKGVAELGDISGAGVMLCFLGMVVMLPAMICLQERYSPAPVKPLMRPGGPAARFEGWLLARPWWVLAAASLFTAWSLFRLPEVRFDHNLLNMQAPHLESVQTELRLIRKSQHSVLCAASMVADLKEAARRSRAFEALDSVGRVESFLALIPQDYEEKRPLVERIQRLLRDISPPAIPRQLPTGPELKGLSHGFLELESTFRGAEAELRRSPDPEVRRQTARFALLLKQLFNLLEGMGPGPILDGLHTFQQDFFADLSSMLLFLKDQRSGPPIALKDLPEPLRIRGLGSTGKLLLRIYPKENIWDRPALQRFVAQLQTVDPEVVGTPVLMFYHTEAMRVAYETSGWYALAVIVLLLWLHFHSLKRTLLALLPKLLGIVWMLGLMAHFQVNFNPANFMALPLVMGIGLVFGIHVLQRAEEEGSNAMFTRSTGLAIVLDALTNLAGFGTLVGAHHLGIASLGFVMLVGTLTNLVTALLVLPALLQVLPNQLKRLN